MRLSRELWDLTQTRKLGPDDDMTVYRRNLERGLAGFGVAAPMLAKYVGGTYTSRALAGAQQALVQPVPVAQQRQALDVLVNEVFSSRSFKFDPAYLSRLGIDQFDRWGGSGRPPQGPDFSLGNAVLDVQRGALDNLMSDGKASRMADNETKVADSKEVLSYAELQERLSAAIWQELKAGGKERTVDGLRRNLQREHVKRLVAGLVRPTPSVATDVRAVHRQVAIALEADLKRALAAGGWSSIARAHLADSQAALAEALRAPLVKQGA
jgi:Met-zincin